MSTFSSTKSTSTSDSDNHLEGMVTKNDPPENKLAWLRSQMIGGNVEFNTPFGKRLLNCADHSAAGRGLRYIEDFITTKVLPFYGNTHTSDSYVGQKTTKMVKEATRYIKTCLGAGPDDALIFCGYGTTAAIKRLQEVIGMVVPLTMRDRVLQSLRNEETWVVFVGLCEDHSNILSWSYSLAEVIEIGLDEDGLVDMRALRHKLEAYKDSNRPMLGSFSACSNVTGIYSDTRAIASLLHQYGAFACFDCSVSGPYVEIDMRSGEQEGYDAIFLSPHNFLGGPGTPGILLMHKALYQLRSSAPSTCGGGTVDFVNGFSEEHTLYSEDVEEREDAGTPPIIQKIRASLAFWVKDFIGYNVIKTKGSHREVGNQSHKPLHGAFVVKLLQDLFGIQACAGYTCPAPYGHHLLGIDEIRSQAFSSAIQKGYTGLKPGWTRLSFPYYMSKEEFDFILTALEFIATCGQRFLPLYSFNWKTGSWSFKSRDFMKNILGEDYSTFDSRNFSLSDETMPGMKIMSNGSRDGRNDDNVAKEAINGVIRRYNYYLETARYVASFLPSFPPQRRIPKDTDPSLVHFRV